MKQIVYFLVIFFAFIIQATLFNAIPIIGVKPNLMLVTAIAIGFLKGEYDGLFIGCAAGLLQDCFFSTYIGGNLFLYGFTAFMTGVICKDYYKENAITPMFVMMIATLVFEFGNYVLNVLLRGFTNVGYYMFIRIIPEIVCNCFLMIVVYIFVFAINNKLERKIRHKRKVF